ncbi:MAG: TIGR03618 family F420-dependent PPOX class oxidoreductase [Acidimicrobiia bacterium]|nr:TIGR03618 family F420-dependent PPOX class oxidoreductase [Acidimicrobiia bacterium]
MQLTPAQLEFLTERHLGTLTTIREDGTPHVVAIAFVYLPEAGTVQIITGESSRKVLNVDATGRAAVCQVDGGRWLTLEGAAVVHRDRAAVATAEAAFESRYRTPSANPDRVAIEIAVDRVLGSGT